MNTLCQSFRQPAPILPLAITPRAVPRTAKIRIEGSLPVAPSGPLACFHPKPRPGVIARGGHFFILLAAVLPPAVAIGQHVTMDQLPAYFDETIDDWALARANCRSLLDGVERSAIRPRMRKGWDITKVGHKYRMTFRTEDDRESFKGTLTTWRDRYDHQPFLPLLRVGTARVGDVGEFPAPYKIASSFLVGPEITSTISIRQVIGPDSALLAELHQNGDDLVFMLNGESTDGWTDDKPIELVGAYVVTGTHKYDTVGGSTNTVLVFEPVSVRKEAAAAYDRLMARVAAKKKPGK